MRAEEAANLREGKLLAQLATEQQLRVAEEQRRLAAEAVAAKLQAEADAAAQARARSPVIVQGSVPVQSVPPPGEGMRLKGEFRVSDLKGWKILVVGIIAAIATLMVSVIKAFQPEKAPVVVDNSATIRILQTQVSTLATRIETIAEHVRGSDGFNASAFEAACIKVTRGEPAPALQTTSLVLKRQQAKCPSVRIDTPQPILPKNSPPQ